jgi:hypothetical protein
VGSIPLKSLLVVDSARAESDATVLAKGRIYVPDQKSWYNDIVSRCLVLCYNLIDTTEKFSDSNQLHNIFYILC